jgi:hypothetical protein
MESTRSLQNIIHGLRMESTRTPHGIHTDSTRNPHGLSTESTQSPHGVSTESIWTPWRRVGECKVLRDSLGVHREDTKKSLRIGRVVEAG